MKNHWVYLGPAIHFSSPLLIILICLFLLYHSFTFPRLLSPLCHHQSTLPWSRVIPSPYHLLFLHYSTSSSSSLSSPPLLPSQKSLLRSHPYITIPLTFSVCPPRLLISCHCHRPLAARRVFIILIITLIISPAVPKVQYLYVLDVLYSIKAVCKCSRRLWSITASGPISGVLGHVLLQLISPRSAA